MRKPLVPRADLRVSVVTAWGVARNCPRRGNRKESTASSNREEHGQIDQGQQCLELEILRQIRDELNIPGEWNCEVYSLIFIGVPVNLCWHGKGQTIRLRRPRSVSSENMIIEYFHSGIIHPLLVSEVKPRHSFCTTDLGSIGTLQKLATLKSECL